MGVSGDFIVIDGPDGSGKSTLAKNLGNLYVSEGRGFLTTRDPGGSPFSIGIRSAVTSKDFNVENTSELSQILAFLAARVDTIENVIRPIINTGWDVICDRFSMSTSVYQILGHGPDGVPEDVIGLYELLNHAISQPQPDIHIQMSCDRSLSYKRIPYEKRDVFESRGLEYLDNVYAIYSELRDGINDIYVSTTPFDKFHGYRPSIILSYHDHGDEHTPDEIASTIYKITKLLKTIMVDHGRDLANLKNGEILLLNVNTFMIDMLTADEIIDIIDTL